MEEGGKYIYTVQVLRRSIGEEGKDNTHDKDSESLAHTQRSINTHLQEVYQVIVTESNEKLT
jgi:hypothetical protein